MIYQVVSLSKFQETAKSFYCFGAGKAFDNFMKEFAHFGLENHIKAIVDNNPTTSAKVVNNLCIPVISLNQMLNEINGNDCILITTAAYEEVMEQLEKIEQLNNIRYYIYSVMWIEQYDYDRMNIEVPSLLSKYNHIKIPKVIHYCWFGKKEMPRQYKEWMKSWKQHCPDYEIIEWNEDNYDIHKSRYMCQAYEMKKWAFVSDYARIDIINEYGGVYLDTDVELVKNIDEMLKNDAFCGFETYKYVNYGLGFGAKKCNSILSEIKEYYDNIDFLLEDGTLNQTVCPVIQTKIMKKHGLNCNGKFQELDDMTVYPSRVLCGMSPYSFRIERNLANTYAIHHFNGSWIEDKHEKNMLIARMKKWGRNEDYIYPDS